MTSELYKEALKQTKEQEYKDRRNKIKQELYSRSLDAESPEESEQYRTGGRFSELADMIRNYASSK